MSWVCIFRFYFMICFDSFMLWWGGRVLGLAVVA